MPFLKIMTSAIIVLAIVITLASFVYPSITISRASTETLANRNTYTKAYTSIYPQTLPSTSLVPYSTATAWFPGDPICDIASMACTPYPTPTATFTYSKASTSFYGVTTTSEWLGSITSEFTVFSMHTSYEKVPVYAVAGLSNAQFAFIAVLIIVVGVMLLFYSHRHAVTVRASARLTGESAVSGTTKYCHECGAKMRRNMKFCEQCGTKSN